ncbi:TSC22 domain family protein 1-like isoform X3 [Myxocyprinus asiaticus]|uniref:TSC22 domain family protein 1-like isoform X3 n=1 Tax=Myxocyprinus asiaticus TaxID=70543 RepID=UPI0022227AAA|nr:TSC22 domain family protein 1-like isoform X3 [Myxocyprinus asiaticus]
MQMPQAADIHQRRDELTLEFLCAAALDVRSLEKASFSAGESSAHRIIFLPTFTKDVIFKRKAVGRTHTFASVVKFIWMKNSMNSPCYSVAMDLGVCQLRHFSISFLSSLLGTETSSVKLDNSSSGASVVAIDNKIEQAMDLVKSHLMYAVREEVEVLKEQIKELIERNSQLEQENNLLKNLASPEQLAQFQAQVQSGSPPSSTQGVQPPAPPAQLAAQISGPSA